MTNKYILLKIYFLDIRDDKDIRVKIIRETYLINNLKVKILLRTDIIESKKINIITFKSQVYIRLYNIIVIIDLKSKTRDIIIKSIIVNR